MQLLEHAKSKIASDGCLSESIRWKIYMSFCFWNSDFAYDCFAYSHPEGKTEDRRSEEVGDKTTDKERAAIVESIDLQLARISRFQRLAEARENLAIDAEARSFSLPTTDATDKILRYEAHLDRQLYRAMDQLERLQRQRKGETVPPPLSINLGRGR